VIKTDPSGGSSIAKGGTVTVFVSKGVAKIQVPNVTGMQSAQAQQKLASVGLNNVVTKSDPQSTQPQGQVDHMNPQPGTQVDPNTRITLYVSGGGTQVQNVVGDTQVQAQTILQGQGFKVQITVTAAPNTQPVPPGTVWAQNPDPGTVKPVGSTIQIFVQPQATASPTPTGSPTDTGSPSPTATATTTTPPP
jgi:beta-lactam-binding protein with PASTA domain